MKYSYNWLQKHIEEKLPDPESLKQTIIFGAFEVEDMEMVDDDTIMDIKVLPDRAHDALGHYGMAREVAGLLGLTLKPLAPTVLPEKPLDLKVEVQSELCRRYIAIKMESVNVGPSPAWLAKALTNIGQKSINNIVDATNYVLFDRGQPIHAFDASAIDGGIVVRMAHEHEHITTLSGEEKELNPSMLVIADYLAPLAIAGVKGGKSAEIVSGAPESADSEGLTEAFGSVPDHSDGALSSAPTKTIIIEVGNFEPTSIRKTSRALGLITDASKRFENDLTCQIASSAASQVIALIKDIAGGEATSIFEYYPKPVEQTIITFTVLDIARLLGPSVTAETIHTVFKRYHYEYTNDGDTFTLHAPYKRIDLTGAHDIAEEIGRVMGYDTIKSAALPFTLPVDDSPTYQSMRAARAWLVHDGYREVMTYAFRKKGDVYIARGPKDKSALRTNLSDGLKESYDLNRLNAALLGIEEVKLFEIGTVFFADREEIHVATIEKGNVKETTLEEYIKEHAIVTDNVSLELASLSQPFKAWSPYPFITRDIAVWVGNEQDEKKLADLVHAFAQQHCARDAVQFDRFTKDGRTSVAYRLVFQATDKTLTDTEVEEMFAPLVASIKADQAFEVR